MAAPRPHGVIFQHAHETQRRPAVKFDDNLPSGVDPEAKFRAENRGTNQRIGSTSSQREGFDPGYVPGYGAPAPQNRPMGFTSTWDEQFQPGQIHIPQATRSASEVPSVANPPPPSPPDTSSGGDQRTVRFSMPSASSTPNFAAYQPGGATRPVNPPTAPQGFESNNINTSARIATKYGPKNPTVQGNPKRPKIDPLQT